MSIIKLKDYPDDGKHQEYETEYPFEIRKGEDGYIWIGRDGREHYYNMFKSDIIDKRWIVQLKQTANKSLRDIFDIKVNKDLNKILKYCKNIYIKSLKMEFKRIQKELAGEIEI